MRLCVKVCNDCNVTKDVAEFHRRGNGYQPICKACRRVRDKAYYERDPARAYEVRLRRKRELGEWARQLKNGPCVDCNGTFHPAAMQWDHLGREPKLTDVADMALRGRSRRAILAEIAKCELVCANCHAVRTYNRRLDVA